MQEPARAAERTRIALEMHRFGGATLSDIADFLDISVGRAHALVQVVAAPFTNAGEVFPPFVSTQHEAGVKVDWGKLTTTVSLFQVTQPSVITNVATNTQVLVGQQVKQGLELNLPGLGSVFVSWAAPCSSTPC